VVALALPSINVDEWRQWLSERDPWPTMGSIDAVPPSVQWFARTADLTVSGWQFRNAMVDALWRGGNWQARVGADEIDGEITLQASSQTQPDGQVTARLSRLRLNPQILQTTNRQQERPKGMPAVDIEVDALRIKDRDWGKVGLLADNTWVRQGDRWVPSWEVKRLSVRLPEAEFKASGSWKPQASQLSAAALGQWRQTDLTWELSLSDAGKLLTRFGMPGVMRGGDGELQGQLSWLGSPLELDQGSLSGSIRMDLGRGQFLKAEPGIAKLLGVLSLQSLPRRLLLDFRDVFQKGFGFDSVSGNAQVQKGVLVTRDLAMRGPSANVLMEGSVSLVNETQNLEVLVVPELDAGTLSLWAGITNPVLGLTTFFAQKVFGDAIADANVRAFKVTGPWQQPEVQAVKLGGQKPAPVRIEEPVSVTDESPESTEVTPAPPASLAQ